MKTKLMVAVVIVILFVIPGFYSELRVRSYKIETHKIQNPIRIVLITDLHSCRYGDRQKELIDSVHAQQPDLIMLVGDIFDDIIDDKNTEYFFQGISGKYPCYYVTGNHEYWSGRDAFENKMKILEKHGVTRLSGEVDVISINGETINICGIDDPDANKIELEKIDDLKNFKQQLEYVHGNSKNDNYTILMSHRPEFFDLYKSYGFDLILSGHSHGGQWRIPGILNGLYAPDQGLFPEYAGGMYVDENYVTMVVSRGLARESTRIPRFYNPPELVVVDLI